ncbi:uncharacterized protein LOC136767673 [Amia ocellicauda]|uniref:uncharacterized protein LOC136767671 n=1 Tax=Amia ocellicauda TaxID=2972642 RepID=UPI003464B192
MAAQQLVEDVFLNYGKEFLSFSCDKMLEMVTLALNGEQNVKGKFAKEELKKVMDRLEVIYEEIGMEAKKSYMDVRFFQVEQNLINQFRKYMEFLYASPETKDTRKDLFLTHFSEVQGEKNLHTLYDNLGSILDTVLQYENKSRKPLEEYCKGMEKLFSVGIIALLGHAALKGDLKESLLKEWGEKMKVVQVRLNAVVEDCINSFPEQAKIDTGKMMKSKGNKTNQQLANQVLEFLRNKYYWVSWSVRIFNTPNKFHYFQGESMFKLPEEDSNINVVVSYSASQEPVKKVKIRELIEEKSKLESLAEKLSSNLSPSVIHIIKNPKDLAYSWSFTDELQYIEHHDKVFVCIHATHQPTVSTKSSSVRGGKIQ